MGALADALDTILGHVHDAYVDAGITDAPARQYVSPGAPPADCELVAVWGVPQQKEAGANAIPAVQNCSIIPQASIQIASWLCVPTGTPPTAAELGLAGARVADHVWAVWSYLAQLISTKSIYPQAFGHDIPCTNARLLAAVQIFDEEGAYAGWSIPMLLDLNPFRTDQAS